MRNYVSVNLDIRVPLRDIDTDDLIEELKDRGEMPNAKSEFSSPDDMLVHIKKVLGLQAWHKKDRVLKEIEDLF